MCDVVANIFIYTYNTLHGPKDVVDFQSVVYREFPYMRNSRALDALKKATGITITHIQMYPDTTYKMRSLAQQSVSHLLQAQEINSILNEPGSVKTRKTNLKHASKNLFIHMLCGDDSNIPDEWKIENHSKRIV